MSEKNGALTAGDLWDAQLMIANLAEQVFNHQARIIPKASYGLSRNRTRLKENSQAMMDARKTLLGECEALDDAGNPKLKDDGKKFDVPPDHQAQFDRGWEEIRDREATFDPFVMPFEFFEDAVGLAPVHFDVMIALGMLAEPKQKV